MGIGAADGFDGPHAAPLRRDRFAETVAESEQRLYTAEDVARLQQVLSLRQLGFSLEEIRDCLNRPDFSPLEVIRLHLARLREQMELQRNLCERLEALAVYFQPAALQDRHLAPIAHSADVDQVKLPAAISMRRVDADETLVTTFASIDRMVRRLTGQSASLR